MDSPSTESPRTQLPLRISLAGAFVAVAVATALLVGFVTYHYARQYLRDDVRLRMREAASLAAMMVDAAAHDRIRTKDDEAGPDYARVKSMLRGIRDRFGEAQYVYTFRKSPDGRIRFVVDAEHDADAVSHVGDEYDRVTAALEAAFREPFEPHVETTFTADDWGEFLSSFAPVVRADGTLAAVVGLDFSLQRMAEFERRYRVMILAAAAIACLAVALMGVWVARAISTPLLAVTADMQRIQTLDLDGRPPIDSRIKEVAVMEAAVTGMKSGLRSFRRYVPAELVTELVGLRKEAVLFSEKREITILFSDIVDSAAIAERLGPEELSHRLGEYFEVMTKTILAHGGTVDKFIGDAVMAFWGAPRPAPDQAVRACLAALDCQRALETLFERWREEGAPPMPTRIGINSGEALVGNFGFPERLAYTAMGDSVNLASRLESLNKHYGTRILIGQRTLELAGSAVAVRPIDAVIVKGKTQGVTVHELLGGREPLPAERSALRDRHAAAFALYQARRWAEAGAAFAGLADQDPTDRAAIVLRDRCQMHRLAPPPADWNGYFAHSEK